MGKPHKLGNVNPCGKCTLWKDGRPVARCLDTPNARAHAFKWSGADYATVQYEGYKPERIEPHNWQGAPMRKCDAGYEIIGNY